MEDQRRRINLVCLHRCVTVTVRQVSERGPDFCRAAPFCSTISGEDGLRGHRPCSSLRAATRRGHSQENTHRSADDAKNLSPDPFADGLPSLKIPAFLRPDDRDLAHA